MISESLRIIYNLRNYKRTQQSPAGTKNYRLLKLESNILVKYNEQYKADCEASTYGKTIWQKLALPQKGIFPIFRNLKYNA
jgi:hypothetical protein